MRTTAPLQTSRLPPIPGDPGERIVRSEQLTLGCGFGTSRPNSQAQDARARHRSSRARSSHARKCGIQLRNLRLKLTSQRLAAGRSTFNFQKADTGKDMVHGKEIQQVREEGHIFPIADLLRDVAVLDFVSQCTSR